MQLTTKIYRIFKQNRAEQLSTLVDALSFNIKSVIRTSIFVSVS